MLKFKETEDRYIIIEEVMNFFDTMVKTVEYTKDLMYVRINNGPFNSTTPADRDWFNKYHMKHFKEEI